MFGGFFANSQSLAPFNFGKALQFDGINDYVGRVVVDGSSTEFDDLTFFGNKTKVTFNCFVKFNDSTTSRQYIVDGGSDSGIFSFAVGRNFTAIGKIGFRVRSGGGELQLTSSNTIVAGQRYAITAVFDGENDQHYLMINGVIEASSNLAMGGVNSSQGIVYGNEAGRYRFPAPITLCEVSVCDQAFTLAQHQAFYNSGNGADIRTISANIAHYHRLNEDLTDFGNTPQNAFLYNFTGTSWVDF